MHYCIDHSKLIVAKSKKSDHLSKTTWFKSINTACFPSLTGLDFARPIHFHLMQKTILWYGQSIELELHFIAPSPYGSLALSLLNNSSRLTALVYHQINLTINILHRPSKMDWLEVDCNNNNNLENYWLEVDWLVALAVVAVRWRMLMEWLVCDWERCWC